MIDASTLRPQRHASPAGWNGGTFERVTDALAAALVASVRRREVADMKKAEELAR